MAIILSILTFFAPEDALSQNWIISGTVLDSAGGPIQGADLDLIDPDLPTVEVPITADNTAVDGSFSLVILTTLPAGTYSLQVNPPPGYVSTTLDIDLSGNLDVGIINVGSGWILSGLVQDSSGNPLFPIDIDIRGSNTGWLDLTGDFTQPDGTFSLTIPALVDEYRFLYRMSSPSPTAFPLEVDGVLLFESTDLGIIVMETAHTLTGLVVDELGAPLPGIDMNIYDTLGTAIELSNDDTDLNGNFSVLVPEGIWDVVHRQVTAAPTVERVPHAFLELNVVKDLNLGTVVLPPGIHVTGLVTGSAGELIADANLDAEYAVTGTSIYLNNDNSTNSGTFDILLPESMINLEIDPPTTGPTRESQLLQVNVAGPGPIDVGTIVLPDAVLLSGRCVDSTGSPVPLVDVELFVSSTGDPYPTLHENGDTTGNFSVAIQPDFYDLTLSAAPFSGLAPVLVPQVQALIDINLGDIILNPGVTLSGTVTATFTPVPGTTVQIQEASTGTIPLWGTTTTDALGAYSLSFAPGTWNLLFSAPQGSGLPDHTEANLDITADLIFDIDLLPQPAPVADLICTLNNSEVALSWTNSDNYSSLSVIRDGALIASLGGDATSFSDLPGAGTHQWSVVATLAGVDSDETSCSLSVAPEPPTTLTCSVLDTEVSLQWINPVDFDQLIVMKDSIPIAQLDGTSTSFNGTCDPGIFLYEIAGITAGVTSATTSCTVTVLPQPVTDLTCLYDGGSVLLSWLEGQGHDAVEIYRDGALIATLPPATGFLEDTGASGGIRTYSVSTVSGALNSTEVNCQANVPPGNVSAVTCLSTAVETVLLNWTPPSDATTVRIERSGAVVIELPISTTSYVENQVPGGIQTYTLVAVLSGIDGVASDCSVDVQTPTSPPVASFTSSVTSGEAPLLVDFLDTSIGVISAWSWNFGDGSTSIEQNPSHTFNDPGSFDVTLTVEGPGGTDTSTLTIVVTAAATQFIRGDCNVSGGMNIADAIAALNYLFGYSGNLTCVDACDSNDDETINIADAIYLLSGLFAGGALPQPPFPSCGPDPAGDLLDCSSYGAQCP